MAGAVHLFLLCGYLTLVSARSVGDVPAGDGASTTTRRSLSSSTSTEAPKPGKSNTTAEHLGGK